MSLHNFQFFIAHARVSLFDYFSKMSDFNSSLIEQMFLLNLLLSFFKKNLAKEVQNQASKEKEIWMK